ncbi:hypothetical protein [Pontibacter sp. G13]|uniref:hypothetical protein n=1 Tax=Pontibacter sp. G13 TaxID=3074898 RepID=UPI00288AECA4|nr:hypothetical protein [Pontibacter sp. G13]WNJ20565.1 hypothetical protein RJD25_08785 [Pontibacter sp. G13]
MATTLQVDKQLTIRADQIQIFSPPQKWDWDVAASGQITKEQFELSDYVPASASGTYFNRSGTSFSAQFSSLLNLLSTDATDFPLQDLLQDLKSINQNRPEHGKTIPHGWTRIMQDDQLLEYQRKWSAERHPNEWLASISDQQSIHTTVIEFEEKYPNQSVSKLGAMTIQATSIAQINILPGSWYDSSIINIARRRPQAFIDESYASMYFGAAGILNSRLSAIIVAMMPHSITHFHEYQNPIPRITFPENPQYRTCKPYILAAVLEIFPLEQAGISGGVTGRKIERDACEEMIQRLALYRDKNWAIGLHGDTQQPDDFALFFGSRGLPFYAYLRSPSGIIGDFSAYQTNIDTLKVYLKGLQG